MVAIWLLNPPSFVAGFSISQGKTMTKQEILASLRECAAKLGRAPKQADLRKMTKITRYWILQHFTDVTDAYREAGILRGGAHHRLGTQTLPDNWVNGHASRTRLP